MDYTFNTLNDKEFELLVRDLFQKEHNITLENFKSGKDEGIDLRYSESTENEFIIQCKHWLKSGISQLKYHLKNVELEKVKKLNPQRYIIATSLPLSPSDKNEILEIFTPYIIQPSDILGKESLNNLLGKYPEIEEKHYKLWLSSSQVLKNIFTEYVRERSRLYAEEIKEKLKLFVKTESLETAQDILENYNVLLITGEPGIGKTMLADYLTMTYLNENYSLTYIHSDLTDAEKVFNPEKKQIFYFDDFLGSNFLEILSEKKFDTQINHLVKAIRRHDDHLLILTSRTTIYNAARARSEIFDDKKFNTLNYQLEISDYSFKDRGEILYNHLFFSNLKDKYKETIKSDGFYFDIIKHENFNPRIIEFITDKGRVDITKPQDYSEFILKSLDNPFDIWNKAFQNQINDIQRVFLITLFSFNLSVEENRFKSAFNKRLSREIKEQGWNIPLNYYNNSIDILINGFIKRFYYTKQDKNSFYLDFINPSVTDFMSNYLITNKNECERIIKSAKYYEQIQTRFIDKESPLSSLFDFDDLEEIILNLLKENDDHDHLDNALLELISVYGLDTVKTIIIQLIPLLTDSIRGSSDSIELFIIIYDDPEIKDLIDSDIENYTYYLRMSIYDFEDLERFIDFLDVSVVDTEEYLVDYTYHILEGLDSSIVDRIESIDSGEIESRIRKHYPHHYDFNDPFEYFWHEVTSIIDDYLDESIFILTGYLEDLGLNASEIQAFNLQQFKPKIEDVANQIEREIAMSYEDRDYGHRHRSRGTDSLNSSDIDYLKNLFS